MKSTELSKVVSVVTGKVGIYEFKETICIVTGFEKGRYIDVAYPIESNHTDMLCSSHFVSCSPAGTFDLTIRAATPSEISRWKYAKGVGASYRKKLKSAAEATNIPWVSAVVTNS